MWENLNEIKVCWGFTTFPQYFASIFIFLLLLNLIHSIDSHFPGAFYCFCSNNTINKNRKASWENKCLELTVSAFHFCIPLLTFQDHKIKKVFSHFTSYLPLVACLPQIDEWKNTWRSNHIDIGRETLLLPSFSYLERLPRSSPSLVALFIGNYHMVTSLKIAQFWRTLKAILTPSLQALRKDRCEHVKKENFLCFKTFFCFHEILICHTRPWGLIINYVRQRRFG